MSFNEFLATAANALAAQFPGVRSSKPHRGRFTLDELGAMSQAAPALRVALWEVSGVTEVSGGLKDVACRFSLAVVTGDAKGLPREVAANNLVGALCVWLPGQTFGHDAAHGAQAVTARNLYDSGKVGSRVQLWEVTWRQTLRLGSDLWAEGGMPSELYAGFSPEIGADHEPDYDLVTGEDGDA